MNFHLADYLQRWFDQYGRHDLPWQHPRSAYRVWVSEIMLQKSDPNQTEFTNIKGSAQITNGLARNNDLSASLPFARIQG